MHRCAVCHVRPRRPTRTPSVRRRWTRVSSLSERSSVPESRRGALEAAVIVGGVTWRVHAEFSALTTDRNVPLAGDPTPVRQPDMNSLLCFVRWAGPGWWMGCESTVATLSPLVVGKQLSEKQKWFWTDTRYRSTKQNVNVNVFAFRGLINVLHSTWSTTSNWSLHGSLCSCGLWRFFVLFSDAALLVGWWLPATRTFTFRMCLYIAYRFIIKPSGFSMAKTALYLITISLETLTTV